MVGRIVSSKSGRDKGYFLVVVKEDESYFYVCDGKERPLSRPKRKNPKHLNLTNTVLEESSYKTDRALRKSLTAYRDSDLQRRNRDV